MGVCCCMSLKKAVITVGIISLITSCVLAVMNMVHVVTFEGHVRSCRLQMASDILEIFPSCEHLTDASVLMAARIFNYILLLVWIGEILFSVLLVVAATKSRPNLMIPWVIFSVLVMLTLLWEIYQAALSDNMMLLSQHAISLVVALYFLVIVRSFGKQVSKNEPKRCCQSGRSFVSHLQDHGYMPEHMVSDPLQDYKNYTANGRPSCSSMGSGIYYNDYPLITKLPSVDVIRSLNGGRLSKFELPPAYSSYSTEEKGPLPRGLGVRH